LSYALPIREYSIKDMILILPIWIVAGAFSTAMHLVAGGGRLSSGVSNWLQERHMGSVSGA
jgi:hypothetical protein